MDRLQKKCFVASTGFHLLLLVILLVGSAFVASRDKAGDIVSRSTLNGTRVLDYVAPATVDNALAGARDPHEGPQLATLDTRPTAHSAPVTRPDLMRQTTPPRQPLKDLPLPTNPGKSPQPTSDRLPKKPSFDFTPITRPSLQSQESAHTRPLDGEQQPDHGQQVAAWQRDASAALSGALKRLASARSGSAAFEWPASGAGAAPYSDFYERVKSVYSHAWIVPDGVNDERATVGVSVTIARDGRVVSARIMRTSGNPPVDHSVQATLDRVNYAAALPEGAAESQRTIIINFNVAASRAVE
jgi:TonB family protein